MNPATLSRSQRASWLASMRRPVAEALAITVLGLGLIAGASALVPNVWWRMALVYLLLAPLAVRGVPLDWRALFKPSSSLVAQGMLAFVVLYGLGAAVFRLLPLVPGLAAEMATLESWRSAAPVEVAAPLLAFIVCGEEVVWRAAVTLPLAARLGPWRGALAGALAFAAAHIGMGVGLLLPLAFAAGLFWNALLIESESAMPPLVCHLLFDLTVLFLPPY